MLFALVPLFALLFTAEVVIRLVRAPTHFGSFRELRVDLLARNYPAVRDPLLGYSPKPDYASRDNHWGTVVTIDGDGMRKNGDGAPPAGDRVIATVGDSFTFGDQVDDDATWPAQLEQILGQPVKNGGVFGYSLAQAVLRAEAMLDKFPVSTLIVSFIPDDLNRCELERRYTPLPWFDLVDGEIVLRNVPIPEAADEPDAAAKRWKDALGHSALVDAVLANLKVCKGWWFENEKQVAVPHLAGKGPEIGKKLMERIAAKCRERNVVPYLLLQGSQSSGIGSRDRPEQELLEAATAVLRHAEQHGVQTIDAAREYALLAEAHPEEYAGFFDGHMTKAGNRWVAERVAAALRHPR